MTERDMFTVKELADELRVTTPTIYTMIKTGEIPARRFGTVYRFTKSDVLELMESAKTR